VTPKHRRWLDDAATAAASDGRLVDQLGCKHGLASALRQSCRKDFFSPPPLDYPPFLDVILPCTSRSQSVVGITGIPFAVNWLDRGIRRCREIAVDLMLTGDRLRLMPR